MEQKAITIITGQSGVEIKECIKKLGLAYLSVEGRMSDISKTPFQEILTLPLRKQYDLWATAFQDLSAKGELSPTTMLTFHSAYYHQNKKELFCPVNTRLLAEKLEYRVKRIIVFIDDLYDVYRRLMDAGEMFEYILNKRKTSSEQAIYESIVNIIFLLNWREMEICISRLLANFLSAEFFVVATKHPTFMIKKLIESPTDALNIYYLSHPISIIRKESRDTLSPFVGELNSFVRNILKYDDNILFLPTSIDELRIKTSLMRKKLKKKPIEIYEPILSPRWASPYPDDSLLAPELPKGTANIEPFNPQNHKLKRSESTTISGLLSTIKSLIHEKQIMSRDFSLVEQSNNGIIAVRPYFQGDRSDGMMGEITHNSSLMGKQTKRKCYVLSTDKDEENHQIYKILTHLEFKKDSTEFEEKRKELIRNKFSLENLSDEEIVAKIEKEVVPPGYDWTNGFETDKWTGDYLAKKEKAKKQIFEKILQALKCNEIQHTIHSDGRESALQYLTLKENGFWEQAPTELNKILRGV